MASQLSPRQREILDLVAEGRTSKEIAVTLGISESTVNWHLANAFDRLGASSRAEAVALAIRSNGNERTEHATAQRAASPSAPPAAWPRLAAVALAIAIAGALLGGATVAALRLGPVGPVQAPTATPANGLDRTPTSSPASGPRLEQVGGEIVPIGGGVDLGVNPVGDPLQTSPGTVLPAVSALPLPSVAVPLPSVPVALPTPAVPSLPVATPPLPVATPPLPSPPLPTPIPTPRLSVP